MVEIESTARDAIRSAIDGREPKWSVSDCVERLTAAGLQTSRGAVQRFLGQDQRRLGLDEWAAWAIALSMPPLDLLVPASESRRRADRLRSSAVREWLAGREPLDEVPEPARFRAAILGQRHSRSEIGTTLRQLADAFDAATSDTDGIDVLLTADAVIMGALRAHIRNGQPKGGTRR